MKVMSIIGIIWFSLCLIILIALAGDYNYKGVAGWGIFALLYAIPYSITGLVVANKNAKNAKNMTAELIQLANLKEKGILTEEEFQAKKQSLI
jgi:hypothetical protein